MLNVLKALGRLTSLENDIGTKANISKQFLLIVEKLDALGKKIEKFRNM
jgi:hypothetical protein